MKSLFSAIVMTCSVIGIGSAWADETANQQAWTQFIDAILEKDQDTVLSLLAPDAVIVNEGQVIEGTEATREFMTSFVEGVTPEMISSYKAELIQPFGDLVVFRYQFGALNIGGTDTVLFEDGKIKLINGVTYPLTQQ